MDKWVLGALGGVRPAQRPPAPAARAPPPPAAAASAAAAAPVEIAPNLVGLRTDEQYYDFVERNRAELAVVNFGSSWCAHCHALLPAFLALAAAFPAARYAVAQVDGLRDAAAGVAYTPTVAVLRRGRVVDSFYGASAQALRDRLWLHAG